MIVGRFFKLIFQFILAILLGILVIFCLLFAGIFAVLELIFGTGRRLFVAFLTGVGESYKKGKEVKTVMQTTMKSKRTH